MNENFGKKDLALEKLKELNNSELHLFSYDTVEKCGYKNYQLWRYNDLYNFLKFKNECYYENYEKNDKIKLFLDIDCNRKDNPNHTLDGLINKAIKLFTNVLKEYGYEYIPIITLNATTDEKISIHIIFPTVIFPNTETMKSFIFDVQTKTNSKLFYGKECPINKKKIKPVLDTSVYKIGCFRLLYCSKKGLDNKLKLYRTFNYTKYKGKDIFLDCLLTNVENIELINYKSNKIVINLNKIKDDIIHNEDEKIDYKNIFQNIQRYDNENIKELLGMLSVERIDTRSDWLNVGILIYCLNLDYKVWDQISRISLKYKEGECEKIWNNFKSDKKYTIKTLYYWAKKDNPELFFKLITKQSEKKLDISCTHINSRYLLDLEKKLEDDTIICNQIEKFFDVKENYVSLNIHSPYDTAKTTLIKAIIEHHKPKRVLWVSYRKTLTYDILGNFKQFGFVSYLDRYYFADKIIIQIESLLKIDSDDDSNVPYYELIIIDEIESILNQFSSTETFHGLAKETYYYLDAIIRASINKNGKIMSFDGDMNLRSYSFLENYGKSLNIVNDVSFNERSLIINPNRHQFEDLMFEKLDEDKKIVLVSMTETDAIKYSIEFKKKYPSKRIGVYTGKTSDSIKKQLEKVNEEWIFCDIVIYTPTIEAGVNFDIIHFDNIFGIISDGSCSQRAYFQMLARVRKISDLEIVILNSTGMKINNCIPWYYDEVKCALIENQNINMTRRYENVGDNIKTVMKIDFFDKLFIYNKVEELNKCKYIFLYLFDKIARKKGFKIKYIEKSDVINTEKKEISFMITKILETPDISENIYQNLLKKQHKNNADEDEKYQIDKHHFKKVLGIEKLNEEIMLSYYRKTGVVNNFASLIDIKNMKLSNDPSDFFKIRKIDIIKNLLKEFGYSSVMDTSKLIEKDVLVQKINNLIETNNFFDYGKDRDFLFPSIKKKLNENTDKDKFKIILCFMNSIFHNYGFKLCLDQVRDRSKSKNMINCYKIKLLSGIDEIIKFRIAQGYTFYDTNNLIILGSKFINDNVFIWKNLAPEKIIENDKIIFLKKDNKEIQIIHNEIDVFDIDCELNYDFDNSHDNAPQNNEIINVI